MHISETTFLVEYTVQNVENEFECSACVCCSVCSEQCHCPMAESDPNEKMAQILGFGDCNYRLVSQIIFQSQRVGFKTLL